MPGIQIIIRSEYPVSGIHTQHVLHLHRFRSLLAKGFASSHFLGANCEDDEWDVFLTLHTTQNLPKVEHDEVKYQLFKAFLRTCHKICTRLSAEKSWISIQNLQMCKATF